MPLINRNTRWSLISLALIFEGIALLQNSRFWNGAAYSQYDMIAHGMMALAITIGLVGGTAATTQSFNKGHFVGALCAAFVTFFCAVFSVLGQAGSFSFQEQSVHAETAAEQSEVQDVALENQIAMQGVTQQREALANQLALLDQQIAQSSARITDYGARSLMKNGVQVETPIYNGLMAERTRVSDELAKIENPGIRKVSSRPSSRVNAFTSLFSTVAPAFGMKEELMRGYFFTGTPFLCVLITVCLIVLVNLEMPVQKELQQIAAGNNQFLDFKQGSTSDVKKS